MRELPQLVTMSRREVEQFVPTPGTACISIISPGNTAVGFGGEADLRAGYAAVLRLAFHDLPQKWPPAWPQMNDLDAKYVADFVVDKCVNGGQNVRRIVVHCDMGISRSVSMADAIHRVLYGAPRREERPPNLPVYALTLRGLVDKIAHIRVS